jgi:hypothetical protein
MPPSIPIGDVLSIKMNATDPDGIKQVDFKLLDSANIWHNYTALYLNGLYVQEIDISNLPIGKHSLYVYIIDDKESISTQIRSFQVLGRLLLSGLISKSEVVSGEPVTIIFTVMDQNEKPVSFSTVNVTVASRIYKAKYVGSGKYMIVLNTSEIPEGIYILKASATKDMYLPAECSLPLVIRPWWWPYLPYSAIIILSIMGLLTYYMKGRRKAKTVIVPVEPFRVLEEATKYLDRRDYKETIKYSAEI